MLHVWRETKKRTASSSSAPSSGGGGGGNFVQLATAQEAAGQASQLAGKPLVFVVIPESEWGTYVERLRGHAAANPGVTIVLTTPQVVQPGITQSGGAQIVYGAVMPSVDGETLYRTNVPAGISAIELGSLVQQAANDAAGIGPAVA